MLCCEREVCLERVQYCTSFHGGDVSLASLWILTFTCIMYYQVIVVLLK